MALQHPQNEVVTLELLGDFPSLSYCPAMRVLIQVNPDGETGNVWGTVRRCCPSRGR